MSSTNADEIRREGYNAAFYELGLSWHWDADTYRSLLAQSAGNDDCVRIYIETRQPHLLKVYDASFLVNVIKETHERCCDRMQAAGRALAPRIDWAEIQRPQVGV